MQRNQRFIYSTTYGRKDSVHPCMYMTFKLWMCGYENVSSLHPPYRESACFRCCTAECLFVVFTDVAALNVGGLTRLQILWIHGSLGQEDMDWLVLDVV